MTDPAWKLFLRTGLPQAYNFAKAREQVTVTGRTRRNQRNKPAMSGFNRPLIHLCGGDKNAVDHPGACAAGSELQGVG